MPYTAIEHFKGGLVRYAHPLSLPPGSLYQADDVVLSVAGEIEKRQDIRFLEDITVSPFAVPRGLISANGKLYSYWHLSGVTSGSITVLQAQHPAVIGGASTSLASHVVTEFVCGCAFQNQPFAVLKFGDGSKWAYYGDPAVLVGAFRNGVVIEGLTTLADVANHITSVVSSVSKLTVTQDTALDGAKLVDIVAPPASTLNISFDASESASGTLELVDKGNGVTGSEGTQAYAILKVLGVGEGAALSPTGVGGTLSRLEAGDGTDWVDLIAQAVVATSTDTAVTFASKIVTAINDYKATKDYTARLSTSGATVYVETVAAVGAESNGFKLRATLTGPVCISGSVFTLSAGVGNKITSIKDESAVELLDGGTEVAYATTATAWRDAVVKSINTGTDTHGYVASPVIAVADSFGISKAVTTTGDEDETIEVTFTAGVVGSAGSVTGDEQTFTVSFTETDVFVEWTHYPWLDSGPQHNRIFGSAGQGYTGTLHGTWIRVSPDEFYRGSLNTYRWKEDSDWFDPIFEATYQKDINYDYESFWPPKPAIFELELFDESTPVRKWVSPRPRIVVSTLFVTNFS